VISPRFAIGAAILLGGCSASISAATPAGPSNVTAGASHRHLRPQWTFPASVVRSVQTARPRFREVITRLAPARGGNGGIYVSEFLATSIFGYQHKNTPNNPPLCSVGPVSNPNGIAVDRRGNLIDPDGGSHTVIVFSGPGMCGSEVGSVFDPFGQPTDASSADAVKGEIAVANIFGPSAYDEAGSISMCTLAGGCTTNLRNSAMYEVAGVAMDKRGNCWADASDAGGTATLTYFARCSGSGKEAKGFVNQYYGGLDFDRNGNLVTVSAFDSKIYVYSGCNPACSLIGGPFPMVNEAVYGHLNKKSQTFCTGDFELGQIDVYHYSRHAVTHWYSFNNGLNVNDVPVGCAFDLRSSG
jgi:hypothetical protein